MNKPTGKLKFAYDTIARMEGRIKELESHICIYARENIDWVDFDSDQQALQYFADFAENATDSA